MWPYVAILAILINFGLTAWAALNISSLIEDRDKERAAEIERAEQRAQDLAVEQCLSRNAAREADKARDLYWLNYIISNSSNPESAQALFYPLLEYTLTANDPLDCNPNSPTFGEDTTPPPIIGEFG